MANTHTKLKLSLFDAICTIIGIILGTGIFVAPAAVAAVSPHPGVAALVWLAGGCIALCGAFCYAECGVRLPVDGGFFVYYEKAFGSELAKMAGWAAWLLTYPASLTAMASIAARYLHGLLHKPPCSITTLTALMLLGTTLIVALGVRVGAWLQRVLTLSKVSAMLLVAVAALWVGYHDHAPITTAVPLADAPWNHVPLTPALCLTAFATLMFTFDGWSDITLLTGEIDNPKINLGRAAMWGVLIPAVCYALLQIAVMVLLPAPLAANSTHVLAEALTTLGGSDLASRLLGSLAIISAIGALHGVLSGCSRLGWSMATMGHIPKFFAALQPRFATPWRALVVPAGMSLVYLYTSSFAELMGYCGFAIWLYYAMTAVALLRLRRAKVGEPAAEANAPKIWRAPGGALAPCVVIGVASVMTALQVHQQPMRTLLGLSLVALPLIWQKLIASRLYK